MDKDINKVKYFKLVEPNYSKQLPKLKCTNFVHPIQDCILEGFSGHSKRY